MTADFFVVAAVAGLLSFFTPCVFPMVPITLAYFGRAEGAAREKSSSTGWFVAGIVLSFTLLGLLIAAVFGAAGVNRFAADPRLNLVLAGLLVFFAANLFGFFEIPIPSAWLTRAAKSTSSTDPRRAAGAALLGAVFALTSLTCTAPFVGSLLVLTAGGARTMPLIGMLVFSSAFALPFYVLTRVPRLLERLPRSGSWLHTLRVCVGVIELAAALKFVSNADVVSNWGIVTRSVVLAGWTTLAAGLALYLLALGIKRRSIGAGLAAAAFAAIAVPLTLSANGGSYAAIESYLPPARSVATTVSAADPWILNDYPAALQAATNARKPVFIDFTGYTCTNCRWMESHIFNRPDVRASLGNFVLARLYTDGQGEVFEKQQAFQENTFGTVALPLYAVVNADGTTRATISGIVRDPARFIAFLESARPPRIAVR